MRFLLGLLLLFSLNSSGQNKPFALAIHGGAGTIKKSQMSPEKEKAYHQTLEIALEKGYEILKNGGTSSEAVLATIQILEDSPLFNAGKGAVFTHEGKNEMDAAFMDGNTKKAGAVAGITIVKNPILAAYAVLHQSDHVLLTGKGAEEFSRKSGLTIVDPSYFYTESRWKSLQQAIKEDSVKLDSNDSKKSGKLKNTTNPDKKFGTVGCVALDQNGNLAAGTSTGGMTNKRWGRVGDTPIIGAGTYANNQTCAVSATGHGEYFIRSVVAYDISALMDYKGLSLKEAAEEVVMKKLVKIGGEGGVIAIDAKGNIAMPFNSEGMYRGFKKSDGTKSIQIY